jgi:hypothetical protein
MPCFGTPNPEDCKGCKFNDELRGWCTCPKKGSPYACSWCGQKPSGIDAAFDKPTSKLSLTATSGFDGSLDGPTVTHPAELEPTLEPASREGEQAHYPGKVQAIDLIEDQKLDFFEGNIIKYVTRYKRKNGLADLKKALTYLKRLIQREEAKQ